MSNDFHDAGCFSRAPGCASFNEEERRLVRTCPVCATEVDEAVDACPECKTSLRTIGLWSTPPPGAGSATEGDSSDATESWLEPSAHEEAPGPRLGDSIQERAGRSQPEPAVETDEWFIRRGDDIEGPLTLDRLLDRRERGYVADDTLVARGTGTFGPLAELVDPEGTPRPIRRSRQRPALGNFPSAWARGEVAAHSIDCGGSKRTQDIGAFEPARSSTPPEPSSGATAALIPRAEVKPPGYAAPSSARSSAVPLAAVTVLVLLLLAVLGWLALA